MNERVCAVDINIGLTKYRVICIYMPHVQYADSAVEEVYGHAAVQCSICGLGGGRAGSEADQHYAS